jgi:hypothetical protein
MLELAVVLLLLLVTCSITDTSCEPLDAAAAGLSDVKNIHHQAGRSCGAVEKPAS